MRIRCKICGKEFFHEKEAYCRAQLTRHLKLEHNMTLEAYKVQTEFNGVHPLCPCGCGKEIHMKGWNWNAYATDICYSNCLKAADTALKEKLKPSLKKKFDVKEYYARNYDETSFKEAWNIFKQKETPLHEISKLYKVDKRTLKKVWIAFEIATSEEIEELVKYYQYEFGVVTKGYKDLDGGDEYTWLYRLLKSNPGKYNLRSLYEYYNEKHDEKLQISKLNMYNNLKRLYGDEIDVLLAYGYHSNEEYEFYKILKFYIPDLGNKIVLGKSFITATSSLIYDFFINRELLIEYDSKGTYHQNEYQKGKDEEKENFAKENGYMFLRLNKSDVLNPNTIFKIKEMLHV